MSAAVEITHVDALELACAPQSWVFAVPEFSRVFAVRGLADIVALNLQPFMRGYLMSQWVAA